MEIDIDNFKQNFPSNAYPKRRDTRSTEQTLQTFGDETRFAKRNVSSNQRFNENFREFSRQEFEIENRKTPSKFIPSRTKEDTSKLHTDPHIPIEEPHFRYKPKFNIPPSSKNKHFDENKENRSFSRSIAIPEDVINYDEDFLPNDVYFLLGNEENNLATFREKIEKDKAKVEADFASFSKDLMNHLDELRIRISSAIDVHYQELITKYKAFKREVMEFKSIKTEIPQNYNRVSKNVEFAHSSNSHLLKELEEIKAQQQKNKIFQYINLQTKEVLGRVLGSSKEVMQILTGVCVFYNQDNTQEVLREVRNGFISLLSKSFTDQKPFVKSKRVPNYFSTSSRFSRDPGLSSYPIEHEEEKSEHNFGNHEIGNLSEKFENVANESRNDSLSDIYQKRNSFSNSRKYSKPSNVAYAQANEFSKYNFPTNEKVNPPPIVKPLRTNSCKIKQNNILAEFPQLSQNSQLKLFENFSATPPLPDSILCTTALPSEMIVLGLKNGHIATYDVYSKCVISLLKGHNSGICSLTNWQNEKGEELVASGSDHGDCSIIVWKIKEGTVVSKLEGHSAAVVSLIPLEKGTILASASYDKEIFLWKSSNGSIIQKVSNHHSSITCLSFNGNRLFSASLDGKINCWLFKNGSLSIESSFQSDKMVCAMISVPFRTFEVIVGTKEGKVRLLDLQNSTIKSEISICDAPIVELLCLEGTRFEDTFLIASALKSPSLFTINLATRLVDAIPSGAHFVEFGCGITPKLQFLKQDKEVKIVGISQLANEGFGIWDLEIV